MKWILVCLGLVFSWGCSRGPDPSDPVTEFRNKHAADAAKFKYIHPVAVGSYEIVWGMEAGGLSAILQDMEKQFHTNAEVIAYVKKVSQMEREERARMERYFNGYKEAAANGGFVCEYEWDDGKTNEVGLLALKSGEIIKREPWISEERRAN